MNETKTDASAQNGSPVRSTGLIAAHLRDLQHFIEKRDWQFAEITCNNLAHECREVRAWEQRQQKRKAAIKEICEPRLPE